MHAQKWLIALLEVRSGHTDSQVGIWKTTDLQKNC